MIKIENGQPLSISERKKEVRNLLLSAARNKIDIKYSEMYKIFEREKLQDISFLTWRHSVWMTVEEVCSETSTPEGAIYYSLLSNKNNIPEDVFVEVILRYRKSAYEERFGVTLPDFAEFDIGTKQSLINYERSRVYRHVNIHH